MTRFKAHIGFVSDQPLPNMLPMLHEAMKPEKVYLLCSEQQNKKGNVQAQQTVLARMGVAVEVVPVADAFALQAIGTTIDELIDRHSPDEVVFNATGGTKPMSIAAFEQCMCKGVGVFYVQTPEIIWLNATGHETDERFVITGSLPLDKFLQAHSVELLERTTNRVPRSLSELAAHWASRAENYAKAYSALNYYAGKAEKKPGLAVAISRENRAKHLTDLLKELEHHKLIEFIKTDRKDSEQYKFKDEPTRQFVNGGWLEARVFDALESLRERYPRIAVVARNVHVRQRPGVTRSEVKNELDVVALIDHQMWVFECKTSRVDLDSDRSDRRGGEEMVYKLAGIMKNMGGLRTRGCVVSFNPLRDVEKSRAELLDIAVIDGRNLANLRSKLIITLGLAS